MGKLEITPENLSRGLGVLSVGLGAMELAAPGAVSRNIGLGRPKLVRGYGARELAAGAMLFAKPSSPAGAWARVAGDVVDLGTLVTARPAGKRQKWFFAAALATVVGALALDIYAARKIGAAA